ncbi:MAG: STAS domain-containing protein [Solirubrobacteraceae bacterium]
MALKTPVFRIHGPLYRSDLPGLYGRVCVQLQRASGQALEVEVDGIAADAVAVDALARLELAARRHGCRVTVRGTGPELRELIELVGLRDLFLA